MPSYPPNQDRYRLEDNLTSELQANTTYEKRTTCAGVTTTVSESPIYIGKGTRREMVDEVVHSFHERKARGEIFNNSMRSNHLERTGVCGGEDVATRVASCSGTTIKVYRYGSFALLAETDGVSVEGFHNALRKSQILAGTAALANVDAPTLEGFVELGEARETCGTIPGMVRNAIRGVDKLKRSSSFARKAGAIGSLLGGVWLGSRYGLRPIVSSLSTLMEIDGQRWSDRKTARGFSQTAEFSSENATTVEGYFTDAIYTTITSQSAKVRAGVLYRMHQELDSWGLHPQNLPAAAWELMTLSFVADWFWNVGDWIRAVTPKVRVNELSKWTATATELKVDKYFETNPRTVAGWSVACNRYSEHHAKLSSKERSPRIQVGITDHFGEQHFSTPRDFLRAADALFILSNYINFASGRKPRRPKASKFSSNQSAENWVG